MTPNKAATTRDARSAYLVLGMHRSGTSAVTQVLALAGASLPENVMTGDEHNAKGYFEPWKIAMFNDARLREGGTAWDDIFAFPYRPLATKPERSWLNRAAALFEEEYGEARHPLLKDPRVTVLMPFWRTVLTELEVAARCVIPVRHPLAVAGSLTRRNGFAPEKSVLVWTAYMLAAEAYTRDLPRAFVSYDGLLGDWRREVAKIEAAHGAPLPKLTETAGRAIERFLTPELRHNDSAEGLKDLGWAGALAGQVLDWFEAAASGKAPGPAALDKAAKALAARAREIGVLVSPATRDLDEARAELVELRQQLAFELGQKQRLQSEVDALRRDAAEAAQRLDAILADG
ncbi:hypothetical protein [Phenylobacterium sp.]|uniref:hypothetical protein n=1 Tax=Phenylobacterium sp. TaxID=1871053 RepID=UPI0011F91A90|nr:hypothetical protein [Phenylobacterium sp.]THD66877.1 MAG: hypothetical protein E8A12_05990 [Phenylobacterium sp.]